MFKVSDNDIMWVEIHIPSKMQMPYSEEQISQHVQIIRNRQGLENVSSAEYNLLYKITHDNREAEMYNYETQKSWSCVRSNTILQSSEKPQIIVSISSDSQSEEVNDKVSEELPEQLSVRGN